MKPVAWGTPVHEYALTFPIYSAECGVLVLRLGWREVPFWDCEFFLN